ncbi:hypothetical protein IWQ62_006351 [Dispira parvispora]|uniref:C2H2-type domain-containing protein n=1 Tax=Dispira parvispora TaxID=1520584 RepID=A0A9W8E063_9FUNG|nr:hypothetical protein IWQ62_006351 [Dispira parvispora]
MSSMIMSELTSSAKFSTMESTSGIVSGPGMSVPYMFVDPVNNSVSSGGLPLDLALQFSSEKVGEYSTAGFQSRSVSPYALSVTARHGSPRVDSSPAYSLGPTAPSQMPLATTLSPHLNFPGMDGSIPSATATNEARLLATQSTMGYLASPIPASTSMRLTPDMAAEFMTPGVSSGSQALVSTHMPSPPMMLSSISLPSPEVGTSPNPADVGLLSSRPRGSSDYSHSLPMTSLVSPMSSVTMAGYHGGMSEATFSPSPAAFASRRSFDMGNPGMSPIPSGSSLAFGNQTMQSPMMLGGAGPMSPVMSSHPSKLSSMANSFRYTPYSLGFPYHVQYVPTRPYKCPTCNQSFSRNHDLKRHIKIHSGIKPHQCQRCGKRFGRSDALKRHSLVKRCRNLRTSGNSASPSNTPSTGVVATTTTASATTTSVAS